MHRLRNWRLYCTILSARPRANVDNAMESVYMPAYLWCCPRHMI